LSTSSREYLAPQPRVPCWLSGRSIAPTCKVLCADPMAPAVGERAPGSADAGRGKGRERVGKREAVPVPELLLVLAVPVGGPAAVAATGVAGEIGVGGGPTTAGELKSLGSKEGGVGEPWGVVGVVGAMRSRRSCTKECRGVRRRGEGEGQGEGRVGG